MKDGYNAYYHSRPEDRDGGPSNDFDSDEYYWNERYQRIMESPAFTHEQVCDSVCCQHIVNTFQLRKRDAAVVDLEREFCSLAVPIGGPSVIILNV